MKIISFIHTDIFNTKLFNSVIAQIIDYPGVNKIVINTVDLVDKRILNNVLYLQKKYNRVDVIIKEIVREDFIGGILSTLQLFENDEFLILDLGCNLNYIDIEGFFSYSDALGVSRKVRCEYTYSLDVDDEGNIINIHSGLEGSYVFSGIAKMSKEFIKTLKKLLLLYYNPEYIKFENLITSYIRRGGLIKALSID